MEIRYTEEREQAPRPKVNKEKQVKLKELARSMPKLDRAFTTNNKSSMIWELMVA